MDESPAVWWVWTPGGPEGPLQVYLLDQLGRTSGRLWTCPRSGGSAAISVKEPAVVKGSFAAGAFHVVSVTAAEHPEHPVSMDDSRPVPALATRRTPSELALLSQGVLLDLWIEERPSGPTAVAVTRDPDRAEAVLGRVFPRLEIVSVPYSVAELDAHVAEIQHRVGRDFLGQGFVAEADGRLLAAAYVVRAPTELRRLENDLPGVAIFAALNQVPPGT